jgi:hypothetical protein
MVAQRRPAGVPELVRLSRVEHRDLGPGVAPIEDVVAARAPASRIGSRAALAQAQGRDESVQRGVGAVLAAEAPARIAIAREFADGPLERELLRASGDRAPAWAFARVEMRVVDTAPPGRRRRSASRPSDPAILPRVEPAGVVPVRPRCSPISEDSGRSTQVESPAPQAPQTTQASRSASGLRSCGFPRLRTGCVAKLRRLRW